MDERTGTGISPETSGLSDVEGRSAGGGESGFSGEQGRSDVKRVEEIASDRIRRSLEGRKSYVASELDGFASLIEDVGRTLEERGRGGQKHMADSAAKYTRRAARMLREKSTDEIVSTVRGQLRERPAVAFGAALALGFLGARFIKG